MTSAAYFGAHVAATAPQLVAEADVGQSPGVLAAVRGTLGGERTGGRGDVFHPFGEFARRGRPDVAANVGLGADQFGKVHKFVGAEGVGFDDSAPVSIDFDRTFGAGADAFAPVVLIGEAAARPADDRDFQIAEGLEDVVPIAACIRSSPTQMPP